ncbi:MAG: hypothetical protein ACTSO7_17450, partial [Candidatus Heimdallarchaeota archaeon]
MPDASFADLPLFITKSEPLSVWVVNNKLIYLDETATDSNCCWLAYHFLGKLAENELTRKTIPAEILTNHADNFGKVPIIPWPCFSGQIDE